MKGRDVLIFFFYITLERALKLTGADVGSVMILNRPKRDAFTIEVGIGLGDFGEKGAIIPFDKSIAKYAVINKSPLLVEDIETDSRFGRQSRPHYSTKSFICMPLKAINDVIGVLTVSRRKSEVVFRQSDVDTLTPLLSNAAFTYDNLRLLREFEKKMDYTVIGDAVNFVFKLQPLCKTWPNEILLSETTVHAAKTCLDVDQVDLFEIDPTLDKLNIHRLLW